MMIGLEHLSCEERLRELGLFYLQKRQHKGINCTPRKVSSKEYYSTSQKMHGGRTRGNGYKKKFSTLRTNKHWNMLFREVVEGCSPSGTDCSSMSVQWGDKSCQQTCSSVDSSPWSHRSCQEPAPALPIHGGVQKIAHIQGPAPEQSGSHLGCQIVAVKIRNQDSIVGMTIKQVFFIAALGSTGDRYATSALPVLHAVGQLPGTRGSNPPHPWNPLDELSKWTVRQAARDVLNGEGATPQDMMSMTATAGGKSKALQNAASGGPKSLALVFDGGAHDGSTPRAVELHSPSGNPRDGGP
ncbi:hypothetical protein QYF61_012892 [Mycteria americana]|uniref:Uncharacterized protein n=1 Tax=Mycteria americana TaxID=33587 RepID=A0AAN7RJF1_MYCAM|nr:hypothetical protein QYF61_012892 [Mycteria americana]